MLLSSQVQYKGPQNALVWKFPREEFQTAPNILVKESQEVIVFKDGRYQACYSAGLNTEGRTDFSVKHYLGELVAGIVEPHQYQIYFVNRTVSCIVYWGSSNKWMIAEPSAKCPCSIKAHGRSAIAVKDSELLIKRLVGTGDGFTNQSVEAFFRPIFNIEIQDSINQELINHHIEWLFLPTKNLELSNLIKPRLQERVASYGLEIQELIIEYISIVKERQESVDTVKQ